VNEANHRLPEGICLEELKNHQNGW